MDLDENGYIIEPEETKQEYESSQFLLLTYDILVDDRLTDFQKLLFASITGLCRQKGYCWASNSYFEKLFNKSNTQVSTGISKLVELNYLTREMVYKRKAEKDGKITITKQISFRKLLVNINGEQNRGIPEKQNRGIPEKQNQIYNNIINNNTFNLLHKLNGEQESSPSEEELKIINNNENDVVDDILVEEDQVSKTAPAADVAPAKTNKGGLAPLLDEVDLRYRKLYPDVANILNNYAHSFIGRRRLPNLEKWKEMLDNLERYSSVKLIGASGMKFKPNCAIEIVQKALSGKDGAPFTEFDDLFGYGKSSSNNVMEPQFNLNQDFTKGY